MKTKNNAIFYIAILNNQAFEMLCYYIITNVYNYYILLYKIQ